MIKNQLNYTKLVKVIILIIFLSLYSNINKIYAEDSILPSEFQTAGRVEGSGNHFEINNSNYLNVILDSSESINVTLESIPELITIVITPLSSASSTYLNISGLLPLTTYYLYQDNYHNVTQISTDENGCYNYIQDLSQPHLIFIQPRHSTKFIKDDATGGDCSLIGNWDSINKTCVLTTDLGETIEIDDNNIILDGNGHKIIGSNTGNGIYLSQKTNVIIKNFIIEKFPYGIYLFNSANNELFNNKISNTNGSGIYFYGSIINNKIINNTLESNSDRGIYFDFRSWYGPSNNNLIEKNIANKNTLGIHIEGDNNTIKDNTIKDNQIGMGCWGLNNSIINNNISDNRSDGIYLGSGGYNNSIISNTLSNNINRNIYLGGSNNNKIINNTISNSTFYNSYGIYLVAAKDNQIYNNNFIGDRLTIYIYSSINNVFNLEKPIGGNYWSKFDTPSEGCNDLDNDNFCDSPYIFSTRGQDNLPWKIQNGWEAKDTEPPVISHTLLNSEYILNSAPVYFEFSAQDDGVGVSTIQALFDGQEISSGQIINFDKVGHHTIIITASDRVGNTATVNIVFDVVYDFLGYCPPVKSDGSGIYRLGRTLPIKFQLNDANGQPIKNAIAKLIIFKIQNGIIGTDEIIPSSTSAADTGNFFRYDPNDNQYIYNLNLSANIFSVGTWQLKTVLDDGKSYDVLISIR